MEDVIDLGGFGIDEIGSSRASYYVIDKIVVCNLVIEESGGLRGLLSRPAALIGGARVAMRQ